MELAVSLMIAYGPFNLPQGFMHVCIFLRFIENFMHTRCVYMYTNINLQEKNRQRTHSKFKFQHTFGITE